MPRSVYQEEGYSRKHGAYNYYTDCNYNEKFIKYYNNTNCGGNSVVECLLAKEDVASSSLVSRSKISRWTLVPSAYFVG